MIDDPFGRRVAIIGVAALYVLRPLSCSLVLGRFSPLDDTPYASFDRHGISAGYGVLGAVACAAPLLWLLRRMMAPAPDGATAGHGAISASAIVALAIAAPSFVQIDYILALPVAVMWPVIASALAWAVTVAGLWIACVRSGNGRRNMVRVRYAAIGIAILVTLPKLMILTITPPSWAT